MSEIICGPALHQKLQREVAKTSTDHRIDAIRYAFGASATYMGMRFRTSSLFPYENTCPDCHGSGSGGEQSTYCQTCEGRGGWRVEGMMTDHAQRQNYLIMGAPRPLRFAPSFPSALRIPPPPMRGRARTVAVQ